MLGLGSVAKKVFGSANDRKVKQAMKSLKGIERKRMNLEAVTRAARALTI